MLIRADARLLPLRDGCVQCVVTSPPYWGLRDYGTAQWDGGDPACDHLSDALRMSDKTTIGRSHGGTGDVLLHAASRTQVRVPFRGDCGKCGAQRIDSQIGLEPTPDAYVAQLIAVFREVRRVLKDDGTLWLNLGDSYSSNTGVQTFHPQQSRNGQQGVVGPRDKHPSASRANLSAFKDFGALKPKDLVGIPWRVAFALQADGWYLRSDIIWSKPNPMPESVTDRPTKAHEYIFLLSKSSRYFYDDAAIREDHAPSTLADFAARGNIAKSSGNGETATGFGGAARVGVVGNGRNKRSVWHIATHPYPDAHFATFPEKLIEPCIMAGSRPGDLVLDPFIGSGTTGAVCDRLMRRWVGTDLTYQHLSQTRTAQRGLRFVDEPIRELRDALRNTP